jgi:L-2-hydroxyglutarate oxidase LhgO
MTKRVLVDTVLLEKAYFALHDTLGTSHFALRTQLYAATKQEDPIRQIAEELRKNGLTLIRSSKGYKIQKFEPMVAQKSAGHCANKKAPGGCQLHNLQCGWPLCDVKETGEHE